MVVDGVDGSAEKFVHRGGGRGVTQDLGNVGDLLSREAQHVTLEPEIVIRHRNIPHTTERRTVNALHRWANTRETRERERDRKGKAK